MAIPVESYYTNKKLGRGRIAEHNPMTNIRTAAASGTNIAFGLALMDGDIADQVKLYSSASGRFRGVAGYSVEADDLDNGLFTTGDPVPIIDQGVAMVYVEEAIVAGNSVRVRHTGGTPGAFCKTAVPNGTVLLTGAEWRGTGASGTAVELFLSPPFTITADT
jgi:hypothetical protein